MKLESLLGTVVGQYRLNTGFNHHNSNFETASWWEDTGINPGIYPIMVAKRPYDYRNPIGLEIVFQGNVVADFFPSSFGGVMFGKTEPRHVGEPRTVRQHLDWIEAVARTGNSPSREGNPDIFLNPEFWPAITDALRARLAAEIETFGTKNTFSRSEVDEVRTAKIRSGWVTSAAANLEAFLTASNYLKERSAADRMEKNWAWAHQPVQMAA